MFGIAKNITKNLAGSETLPNIVMPNSDTRITDTYFDNAITAYPCGSICFAGSHCLATKGGTPSLYIYLTQLFTAKCQTVKKLVGRGTIVPVLHLCVRHSLRFLIAIFPARIFSKQCSLRNRRPMSSTSTAKPSTASRCPYRGHTMRVTRSWRWVVPSSSSATGIPALLSTTSAYAKGLSNVINPTTL